MNSKLILIIITALLYWMLITYIPYGAYIVLPINLFVTFLHEFGHSFFAIITGGSVHEIMIHPNGSGHAVTSGGFVPLILMGGYIGSAIFGNLLLFVGLKKPKTALVTMYTIIGISVFTAIYWFSSFFTSALLIGFSALAFWLCKKAKKHISNILIIIGTSSLIYILMDYNSGPSSDLAKFTDIIPFLPKAVWAIVWLAIVVYITWRNIKLSFKG